jgi:proteasome accessory factor B
VDPWGLIAQDGGWYLVGFDRDRQATRAFRLSRMTSDPRPAGPVENPAPTDTDLRALIEPGSRAGEIAAARVRVNAGAGAALRRMSADHLAIDVAGDMSITAPTREALVSAALFAGDGAEVIDPHDLRAEIVDSLARIRDLHAEARS